MTPRHALAIALAALVAFCLGGCPDPAAGATGVRVEPRFDAALGLDQISLTLRIDDEVVAEDLRAPEVPRPLQSTGEVVEVLLPDALAGRRLSVSVEGRAGGAARAAGLAAVDLVRGARAAVVVPLAPIPEPPEGCVVDGATVAPGALDPADPCRACRPDVDPAGYAPVLDGTSCDEGGFCDGTAACLDGACVASAPPCAADAVCDEEARRCIECEGDADCAAPNPSCVRGTCTPCPDCPCPQGAHDGGDGACVPEGTCSPGFTRAFLDQDGDGVGAGDLPQDCVPVDLPAGRALVDGDCDDEDPDAFLGESGWPDVDQDGFTGAAQSVCAGASGGGLLAEPSPPPFSSFEGSAFEEDTSAGDGCWDDRARARRADGAAAVCRSDQTASAFLVVRGFDARVPPDATVRGVRFVVVRRMSRSGNNDSVLRDASVRLVVGGAPVGDERALAADWPASDEVVAYGGPTDLWGATLTAADVNDPGFGLALSVVRIGQGPGQLDALVDHVRVEVFTDRGEDCDDGSAQVHVRRAARPDGDGDGYAGGPEVELCVGDALPQGFLEQSEGEDCFDANQAARPGQPAFFAVDRGDGSFDYDCDAAESKQPVTEEAGCQCSTACLATATTTFEPAAACGQQEPLDRCAGDCLLLPPVCAPAATGAATVLCR